MQIVFFLNQHRLNNHLFQVVNFLLEIHKFIVGQDRCQRDSLKNSLFDVLELREFFLFSGLSDEISG
jgi:hypothetical protein